MSDLETLKAQHPFWDKLPAPNPEDLFDQDVVSKVLLRAWKDGGVAYSPSLLQTEITAKVCRSLASDLHSFCSALLALVQQHEAELAKAQETIAELRAERDTLWNHMRATAPTALQSDLAAAQAELAKAQETIATLRDSLQQQARELEEADQALIPLWETLREESGPDCSDDGVDHLTCGSSSCSNYLALSGGREAYNAAIARRSARAQQAEAKKEEE